MAADDEFTHGYHYGDYSGVVFFGPPTAGSWPDRFAASDCFMNSIFGAIFGKCWADDPTGATVPRVVMDWNTLTGWTDGGPAAVDPDDARAFADALAELSAADLAGAPGGSDAALRCAAAVRAFVLGALDRGGLFLEDD